MTIFAGSNTNCAAKVRECTGLKSPLTPILSPLDKGFEGVGFLPSALASREAKQNMCASCGEALPNLRLNAHTPRKKTYPFKLTRGERAGSGGILHAQEFVNSGSAIGTSWG